MKLAKLRPMLVAMAFAAISHATLADDVIYLHDSALLGGGGGGEFRAQCPEDWALTGVNVTIGMDMNSISPVCTPKNLGYSYDATTHLGTYGYAKDRPGYASCLPNLVQGMDVGTSHANIIHHLQLVCVTPDGGTHIAVILTADGGGALTHGGADQRNERTGCPPGEFAVGLYGRYGAYVDAVGLMCGAVASVPQTNNDRKPQPKTKPQDPGRADPLPVGDGGGGGNAGNGAGANGRANSEVTAYAEKFGNGREVDYLEPGEPVTIIQCGNPEDWCEISAPVYGWVYAPQLDR